jgi:MtN3 and saliva related transmembrane protein
MNAQQRTRLLLAFAALLVLAGCEGLTVDTQSLLLPRFTRSEVLGFAAGFGTTFAALPDLIGMLRRKSTQGMNPRMAGIIGSFQVLWIWYGLVIGSRPVVVWNVIGVLTNFFAVGAYLYFKRAGTQAL